VLIAGAITLILTHPGVVLFLLAICVALAAVKWFFVGLFAALGVRASGVLKQLPQRRCGGYFVPGGRRKLAQRGYVPFDVEPDDDWPSNLPELPRPEPRSDPSQPPQSLLK